jgi:hypothetical protein
VPDSAAVHVNHDVPGQHDVQFCHGLSLGGDNGSGGQVAQLPVRRQPFEFAARGRSKGGVVGQAIDEFRGRQGGAPSFLGRKPLEWYLSLCSRGQRSGSCQ